MLHNPTMLNARKLHEITEALRSLQAMASEAEPPTARKGRKALEPSYAAWEARLRF